MDIKEIEDLVLPVLPEDYFGISLTCTNCTKQCMTNCSEGCSTTNCSLTCTTCTSAGSATCSDKCSLGCSPGCAGAQSMKPCINTCTYSETREISK